MYTLRGVCISDMVPFYAGRQAARSGTGNLIREKVQTESPLQLHCKSRMICSGGARIQVLNYFFLYKYFEVCFSNPLRHVQLGVSQAKFDQIKANVQRYGNLIGIG